MRSRWLGMLFVTLMWVPGFAFAQNFMLNGDFDADGSGWTPNGAGTSTYDLTAGSPAVGSMLLSINDPSGNGITQAVQQCVAADGGVPYTFSGRTLLATAASTSAGAGAFVVGQFFASVDCSGVPAISSIAANTGTAAGTPAVHDVEPYAHVAGERTFVPNDGAGTDRWSRRRARLGRSSRAQLDRSRLHQRVRVSGASS